MRSMAQEEAGDKDSTGMLAEEPRPGAAELRETPG